MILGCGITLSGVIDRGLTARICSVVLCDGCSFFGAAASSIAVALFKAVAAGVITPETPAERNGETIIFINIDSSTIPSL